VEDATAPTVSIATRKLDPLPLNSAPVIPRVIRTNVFSTGSSVAPTLVRAPSQVQTGGFGDPNGIPAKANLGESREHRCRWDPLICHPAAAMATGAAEPKGVPGVVASAGFGGGTATNDPASQFDAAGRGPTKWIWRCRCTGSAHRATLIRQNPGATPLLPAEIISKPTPVYTQEARSLRIEGEVLLEVVLEASGSLRVVRVVRGLGHGLDDNAVKAAERDSL
jgi:hypothetical protein